MTRTSTKGHRDVPTGPQRRRESGGMGQKMCRVIALSGFTARPAATSGSAAWRRCTAAPRGGGAVFAPHRRAREPGRLQGMTSLPEAQLSAIASGLDEIVVRVATLGEDLDHGGTADTANALFEAERALKMAARALSRARRSFGD